MSIKITIYKFLNVNNFFATIFSTLGSIPKFYVLPKVHKDGFPLRSIILAVSSPCYELSKFYYSILKNVTRKKNNYISNSNEFLTNIENLKVPEKFKFTSLDVKSLFTNIPLNLVKAIIIKKSPEIKKFTMLSKRQFLEGLVMIIKYSAFSFNGLLYQQTLSPPMGAPLSPVLAELIMENLEKKLFERIKFPVTFLLDILMILLPAFKRTRSRT